MTVVRRWQIALIGVGVALLALAGVTLFAEVPPARFVGIGSWLLGALIVHDGVVAMVVFGVSVLSRRVDPRVPLSVILVAQGAVAIAAIVTAIVLPAIVKKSIGTANPSILPLDYVAHLGLFYAGLGVVAVVAIALILVSARRRRTR